MQQFFAEPFMIRDGLVILEGRDVNHMKNVLRMKPGENVRISDGSGKTYLCSIRAYEEKKAVLDILSETDADTELPSRLWLFQGLPKGDKMELIVQKAVELGAYAVVPFSAKRSVVRLDEKKAEKKRERWQAVARGAAEQSGRGIIPDVHPLLSFKEAVRLAAELDVILIPYEREEGMSGMISAVNGLRPGQSVGVFIGPEGGFDEEEIRQAMESGAVPVSLGKRILRTETAGLAMLSILMYHLECEKHSL